MELETYEAVMLWRYYQRGYHSLVRSGLYFRQVLRPALSHVYFQRAMPLLIEYARANRTNGELPPGFGDQMQACPLTPRDLLHLDYAICLGYAEAQGHDPQTTLGAPVLEWPGPGGSNGLFIAADAPLTFDETIVEDDYSQFDEEEDEMSEGMEPEDDTPKPSFDL